MIYKQYDLISARTGTENIFGLLFTIALGTVPLTSMIQI